MDKLAKSDPTANGKYIDGCEQIETVNHHQTSVCLQFYKSNEHQIQVVSL